MKEARLRPLRLDDIDNIMPWINDLEVVRNFQNFDVLITREMEEAYLKRMLASSSDKMFAVETEEREYLGNAGIHDINSKNKLGRLGIIIGNKNRWGEGYAQSALKELLKHSFGIYLLNRVELSVFIENERAKHIYEKAGFVTEGVQRKRYADREGKFHDMVMMSMLKEDYDLLRGASV